MNFLKFCWDKYKYGIGEVVIVVSGVLGVLATVMGWFVFSFYHPVLAAIPLVILLVGAFIYIAHKNWKEFKSKEPAA